MISSSPAQRHDNKKEDAAAGDDDVEEHHRRGCHTSKPSPQQQQQQTKRLNKSAVPLVPGTKPLKKHRFYLDLKNHITSGKLEAKIKELGGVLELFLIQEVTHVVTDRETWLRGARAAGARPRTRQPPPPDAGSVVGGRQRTTPTTPVRTQPPPPPPPTPPATTPVRGRPKTRADAMLERARNNTPTQQQHAANVSIDALLEQAAAWGIPVWSLEKAFAWLEKVVADRQPTKQTPPQTTRNKRCKLVDLKAPYVKFEAFDRRHRPVFKEIRNWPAFNLQAEAGSTAVVHKAAAVAAAAPPIMTKSRAHPQQRTNEVSAAVVKATVAVAAAAPVAAQSGYCELCREEYHALEEHLDSKKHAAFVRDASNYLQLDTLIGNGTDLSAFLAANDKCNGLVDSAKTTNCTAASHKMPRTRTASINDYNVNHHQQQQRVKSAPVSPTVSESGHHRLLRTRKANMTYIGLTAHEQEEQVKPEGAREVRELRSATRVTQLKTIESDTWSSGRPKRACLRQKQPSFLEETGLQSETRGYYKVEMTPKLRSSALYKEPTIVDIKKSPFREDSEPDDSKAPMTMRLKRLRTSELRQLSNEAENFLFPKKDETSSEEDIDGEGRDTTVTTTPGDSIVISSETDDTDDVVDEEITVRVGAPNANNEKEDGSDHGDHDCETHAECGKRKRLSHAEAFIEDNKKYYKFETPGSRLRYHGTHLTVASGTGNISPVKRGRVNGDLCDGVKREVELVVQEKTDCDTETKPPPTVSASKFSFEELQFSFETIPKSEPWYETFSRQDHGLEYYTCFSDSGYWKPFLLPYQMGRIEPLDPKVCIQTYTQIKKLLGETSSGSNSTPSCTTPDCSSQGSPAPETDENSKASEDSAMAPSAAPHLDKGKAPPTGRRRRKGILMPSKNPRKSPRQHASTLAILSSLIQHRKKRKSSNSNHTLDAIPEELAVAEGDEHVDDSISKRAEEIDELLTNAFNDLELPETNDADGDPPIDFTYKSDAIEILEDYEASKMTRTRKPGALCGGTRRSYSPGKKPGRKKKKNRTGWPKHIRKTNLNNVMKTNVDDVPDENVVNHKQLVVVPINRSAVDTCDGEEERVPALTTTDNDGGEAEDVEQHWESSDEAKCVKTNTNDVNANTNTPSTPSGRAARNKRRLRSCSSSNGSSPTARRSNGGVKRARRMPASPRSPRVLRKPRGRFYRER